MDGADAAQKIETIQVGIFVIKTDAVLRCRSHLAHRIFPGVEGQIVNDPAEEINQFQKNQEIQHVIGLLSTLGQNPVIFRLQ